MAIKLSAEIVKGIAEEVDILSDECVAYLNRETGELFAIFGDFNPDEDDLDNPEVDEDTPEWQKEDSAKRREVLNDDKWIALPASFVHEWEIMKEFSEEISDERVREDLLQSIRGSGAFRRFKVAVDQHQLRDEWFAFKNACILATVEGWLRSQDIEFEE